MRKGVLAAAAVGGSVFLLGQPAFADEVQVEIHAVDAWGVGPVIGSVKGHDSSDGLVLEVVLTGLLPGAHKFYLDEGGGCETTQSGGGPLVPVAAVGHRGALPQIDILTDEDGALPYRKVLVARDFTVAAMKGGTLTIVGTSDNYRDEPTVPFGAGRRVACGAMAP